MLCQVACGNQNVLQNTDYNANNLPAGKNSTFGWGNRGPDPKDHQKIDGGKTTVPLGKIVPTKSKNGMGANEYIVYN